MYCITLLHAADAIHPSSAVEGVVWFTRLALYPPMQTQMYAQHIINEIQCLYVNSVCVCVCNHLMHLAMIGQSVHVVHTILIQIETHYYISSPLLCGC